MVVRVRQGRTIISPWVFGIRGFTLVEFFFALIIMGILAAIAAPALQVAVGRNAVDSEAQRLVMDIRLARSEAITRGIPVALCQSVAANCDPDNPGTCRCKVGVAAKRYDQGWLIYTSRGDGEDFDPDKDQLIRIGGAAGRGIEMRSNNAIKHWLSFGRSGGFQNDESGELAVCQDGLSTDEVPGKMINVMASGRIDLSTMEPGEECLTNLGS